MVWFALHSFVLCVSCRYIDDLFHISRELMVIIVLGLIQSGKEQLTRRSVP